MWQALADSVSDAKLSAEEAVAIFVRQAPQETNDDIIVLQYQTMVTLINNYVPKTYRPAIADQLFFFVLDFLNTERVGANNELATALK